MTMTPAPQPEVGARCWRDRISPTTGATVLTLAAAISDTDSLVELSYDEGGSGWWPLSTLVFEQA
jgi:hypothetical protein